ncbi:MAG: HlyD family efflux transporter periplasmic adaptor subunit [Polyangiaceae bacterium]
MIVATTAYYGYRRWSASRPLEWTGTIEARTIEVGSRTGGRVKSVLVREGDHVDAGQPILVLESGDLDAQHTIAEAQLDQAKATLAKLRAGPRSEEIAQARARADAANAALLELQHGARYEQIRAAQGRVAAAQSAVDKAKLDFERATKLHDSGAISKAELDGADSALKGTTAQLDVAQQSLQELQSGSRKETLDQASSRAKEAEANAKLVEAGARSEDILAAEAQVKGAEGRLAQLDVVVSELTIRAPVAARVETLDFRPGDLLGPNATAATLLEDTELFARIYVPETQLGFIHPGDEVPVYVDSFPDKAFSGVVDHIDMRGQYSPRNLQTADERANQVFAARVSLKGDASDLRAGMAAVIRVRRGSR